MFRNKGGLISTSQASGAAGHLVLIAGSTCMRLILRDHQAGLALGFVARISAFASR